jgi:hypothetical protein
MKKTILLVVICVTNFGCIPRGAFQPSEPSFMAYKKIGASDTEIKKQMLNCGYKNPFYPTGKESLEESAKQEICMFRNGYVIKSGYKGVCYVYKDWQTIPTCVEYRKEHP